jgi:hypothetical protein
MGRPPDFTPHETEAVWQIIENGWIYLVADPDRTGKALLTLMVDNLDRHVAALKERGLAVGAIETQPGRFRKAEVTDPEGNTISFGQALSPATTDEAGPQTCFDKTAQRQKPRVSMLTVVWASRWTSQS